MHVGNLLLQESSSNCSGASSVIWMSLKIVTMLVKESVEWVDSCMG